MYYNSWKVIEDIDSANKLTHYMCSCSHTSHMTINDADDSEYICPKCSNNVFLKTSSQLTFNELFFIDDFKFKIFTNTTSDSWVITILSTFPKFEDGRYLFENIKLFEIITKKDGSSTINSNKMCENIKLNDCIVSKNLKSILHKTGIESLIDLIINNPIESIKWINQESVEYLSYTDKLLAITYFIKQSHLKDKDYFRWEIDIAHRLHYSEKAHDTLNSIIDNKTQKSVRKAIYTHYTNTLSVNKKKYNPKFDYVINRVFDDTNYLNELILISQEHKNQLFLNIDVDNIFGTFYMLMKHYNEKELFKIFKDAITHKDSFYEFKDVFRMLENTQTRETVSNAFIKQRANVKAIHDEIVFIRNVNQKKINSKMVYEYNKLYQSAEVSYKHLTFKLIDNYEVLYRWGCELNNCMSSYHKNITANESIIYGIFIDDKLKYSIELRNYKVVQAKAKNNANISTENMEIIYEWEKLFFQDSIKPKWMAS